MPVDVILGLQWGDEGKGKIVDLLSSKYDIIARFQGGPNAGHTIIIDDRKFILHQVPSGIIRDGVLNVIGNGVVLDPIILRKEIENLEQNGIEVRSRLIVSKKANLIMPAHRLLDATMEESIGATKIGSTQKGIGPTYQDKIGRFGLRMGDIFNPNFKEIYAQKKSMHQKMLDSIGCKHEIQDALWMEAIEFMRTLQFADTEILLNEALERNDNILAEGAQGTLLDIDFGTYPFVTSSNTVTASVCTGLGIAPKHIRTVFGIFKAYCTRVGEGPFPTELFDETGQFLREEGHEFGSTTGRPRRCGWLDLEALRYAVMLNGVDELIMMKLDVLNKLPEIKTATSYIDPVTGENLPFSSLSFGQEVECQYKEYKGWEEDISSIRNMNDMPASAQAYTKVIEDAIGKEISIISIGPERNQTIFSSELEIIK